MNEPEIKHYPAKIHIKKDVSHLASYLGGMRLGDELSLQLHNKSYGIKKQVLRPIAKYL